LRGVCAKIEAKTLGKPEISRGLQYKLLIFQFKNNPFKIAFLVVGENKEGFDLLGLAEED